MPHRTSTHASIPGAPWLVSITVWFVYLQHIPEEGILFATLRENLGLPAQALQIWMTRLGRWWGYVALPKAQTKGDFARIAPESRLRFTPGGLLAARAWRSLVREMDNRWRERFGQDVFSALETQLRLLCEALGTGSSSLPIMEAERGGRAPARSAAELTFPELLAKLLTAFTLDFRGRSAMPLPVCANLLRIVPDGTDRVRDLPALAGLAKEGVASVLRMATRQGAAKLVSDPGTRTRSVVILEKGLLAAEA